MSAELARLGGVLGCAGLAALLVVRPRWGRLTALLAWALGGALVLPYLAPEGRSALVAAGVVAGVAVAAALAVLFLRWPWLVPAAALACAPARVPVDVGDETFNLLLPLYAVVAGAAVAFAWQLVRGDERARELRALSWPLAALVAWLGASLAWTDDLRQGAVSVAAFYLPFGLLAIAVARVPWSRRWLGALAVQLGAMAVAFAAVGGYQWLTRDVFWNPKVDISNTYAPFYRVNSVFWDPSIYGRFLVLAILAALVVCLFARDARLALGAAALAGALWLGLLVSFSQSSFVALVAGVLVATAVVWGRRAVAALALTAAVLVSVGFSAPEIRRTLVADVERGLNRATSGRATLLETGVRIAADHPVAGVGLGGFKHAYAEREGLRGEEPKRGASHTTPVTVAAEAGAPGLLLFAWLLVVAVGGALRRASRSFAGQTSLVVGALLIAIAVHSLFYNAFFEDPLTWVLLGLAAVVLGWRGEGRKDAAA